MTSICLCEEGDSTKCTTKQSPPTQEGIASLRSQWQVLCHIRMNGDQGAMDLLLRNLLVVIAPYRKNRSQWQIKVSSKLNCALAAVETLRVTNITFAFGGILGKNSIGTKRSFKRKLRSSVFCLRMVGVELIFRRCLVLLTEGFLVWNATKNDQYVQGDDANGANGATPDEKEPAEWA